MSGSPAMETTNIGILGVDADDIASTVRSVAGATDADVDAELEIAELDERGAVAAGADEEGGFSDDLHIVRGEAALLSLVRARSTTPVLPIEAGEAVGSVAREDLEAAIETVLSSDHLTVEADTVAVSVDDEQYRALMDVMAVTTEAAKISEYRITSRVGDESVTVDQVRADGVVAATPTGTPGYGTAAGGPILDRGLQAVAVVAVSPFRIEQSHWVLQLPIEFQVVREEVPVTLIVDDRPVRSIDRGMPVTLDWGVPIPIVRTPVSAPMSRTVGAWRPSSRR